MYRSLKRFIRNESGSVTIEYGIIGMGIGLAFIAVLAILGGELRQIVANSKHNIHNVDKPSKLALNKSLPR
jgi:Flp pilus assembly pilin Flp